MHETDDHVGYDAKRLPVLSNLFWTSLKGHLRRFREIQHRYAIASAQHLSASHLRSENSFSVAIPRRAAISMATDAL